jgi:hypothetical protein
MAIEAIKLLEGGALQTRVNNMLRKWYYQDIVDIDGVGVTSEYMKTRDQFKGDQVLVPLRKAKNKHARTLDRTGSVPNGALKNISEATSQEFMYIQVPFNQVYQEGEEILEIAQHEAGFLSQIESAVSDGIRRNLARERNAYNLAIQILNNVATATTATGTVIVNASTDANAGVKALNAAHAELRKGDSRFGVEAVEPSKIHFKTRIDFQTMLGNSVLMTASDVALKIGANGFYNPFTATEGKRIDVKSGLFGLKNGSPLSFYGEGVWNDVIEILGGDPTKTTGETSDPITTAVNKIQAVGVTALLNYFDFYDGGVQTDKHPSTGNRGLIMKPFYQFGGITCGDKASALILSEAFTAAEVTALTGLKTATNTKAIPVEGQSGLNIYALNANRGNVAA